MLAPQRRIYGSDTEQCFFSSESRSLICYNLDPGLSVEELELPNIREAWLKAEEGR